MYFSKHVPKEFEAVDPLKIIQVSLKTDSEAATRSKVQEVEVALFDYWTALKAGHGDVEKYKSLVNVAARKGQSYRPLREIYSLEGVEGLVHRIEGLSSNELYDSVTLNAVAGKEARLPFSVGWMHEKFTFEALARLNGQARDVFLVMVNKGVPSERNMRPVAE